MKNKNLEEIIEPLIRWYWENKRDLPWRCDINPYKTWVSEIMLQQTRVEAVKVYFERFMKRLPTIYDLAKIKEEELLKLWEGLGYYNRVRNMQKMAQIVVEKYHGKLPSSYEELILLPGIGDYTAGAILSIAYQKKIPCVDGNVLRVISRVLGRRDDITLSKTKQKIREELLQVLPDNVSDFNQSLMELGALICIPNGTPLCSKCPLRDLCVAKKENLTDKIPVKSPKRKRKIEEYTVFCIMYQDKIMMKERKKEGLLAGLYELPNVEGKLSLRNAKRYVESLGLLVKTIEKKGTYKHIFTHLEWNMLLYKVEVFNPGDYLFVSREERVSHFPLPSAFEKLISSKE